jgi:hypothetical protein
VNADPMRYANMVLSLYSRILPQQLVDVLPSSASASSESADNNNNHDDAGLNTLQASSLTADFRLDDGLQDDIEEDYEVDDIFEDEDDE